MKKQSKIKIKPLNAKFFNDLANKIYNPKTKKFLRLCEGLLTNGPDPTDKKRRMHCGLGELYFQMTGQHTASLEEDDVVELAMDNLSPKSAIIQQFEKLKNIIENQTPVIKEIFSSAIDCVEADGRVCLLSKKERTILNILNNIPIVNDETERKYEDFCSTDDEIYLERSKNVSEKFRKIAKILSSIKSAKK